MTEPSTAERNPEVVYKAFDEDVFDQIRRSVEPVESDDAQIGIGRGSELLMLSIGVAADGITQWGMNPTRRDIELRKFLPTEPYTASAFGGVITRYSQMSWELDGPPESQDAAHRMMHQANWGKGWKNFASLFALDLLTQDKGAFVETIRSADDPEAPVIGFRNLEASRCWSTGDPERPVVFMEKRSGKLHELKWYQVWHSLEMPMWSPFHDLQLSALSRTLRACQIWRNIIVYLDEKTGGRHSRALHMVSGLRTDQIKAALEAQQSASDNRLLSRYMQPAVLGVIDPKLKPEVATIEFAGLPDSWDSEKELKHFLIVLSMALGTDYQELAPLPGGGLGTASQSVVLDKKSQQKGAGDFRKMLATLMNEAIMPANVQFQWDETDLDEETQRAENRVHRATARKLQVDDGEVDPAGARQLALDDGDIPEELFVEMNARDLTEQNIRDDERRKILRAQGAGIAEPGAPLVPGNVQAASAFQANAPVSGEEQSSKEQKFAGPSDERLAAEDDATELLIRPFEQMRKSIERRLRELA